jgi:hypothetical protein
MWGNVCVTVLILSFRTGWNECSTSYLGHFIAREEFLVPVELGLGGHKSRSEDFNEEKNLLLLLEIELRFLGCLASSLVAGPDMLFWLSVVGTD